MSGDEMREIRLSLALTMEDLAEWMGVTKGAFSRWESGLRPVPGPVALLMRLLRDSEGKIFQKISE